MNNDTYEFRARDLLVPDDKYWMQFMTLTSLLKRVYVKHPDVMDDIITLLRDKLNDTQTQ